MKAVVLKKLGDFASLTDETVPDLKVTPDAILVKTHAVAVDPIDIKIGSGNRGGSAPMILGSSVAGEVVAVGRNVHDFKVGDRVAANVRGGETYAEEVLVPTHLAAHIPDDVTYASAVSVVLGGQTGYSGVARGLQVKAGQNVLVQGGAGSVGLMAVQTALDAGAKVSATAHGWGLEFLREKFPEVTTFDYKTDDITTTGAVYDAVYNTVGSEKVLADSFAATKADGHVLSIVARSHRDPRFVHFFNQPTGETVQTLLDGLSSGRFMVVVDSELPLNADNVRLDYERLQNGGVHGKLVLTL